ncbi:MAG: protease complex subunit PrcB family protein [Bacillota bacterium]
MRNVLIVGGVCVLAVIIGAWLFLTHPATRLLVPPGVDTPQASESREVKFKVLDQGMNAKEITSRKNYAIYDASELADFWKKVHGDDGAPVPTVDFSKNYVIAVFAGTEPTGGYTISVDKIIDTGNTRSVSVVIGEPGAECTVIEEITSPYQLVVVPFSDAQALSHTDVRTKKDCNS